MAAHLSPEERVKALIETFKDKTPKQMRTIRNNLNNRIKSFEEELKFGKTLPKLSASHMFYELELRELRSLEVAVKKKIKSDEKEA